MSSRASTGVPRAQPPRLPFMSWPEKATEKHRELILSQPCVCVLPPETETPKLWNKLKLISIRAVTFDLNYQQQWLKVLVLPTYLLPALCWGMAPVAPQAHEQHPCLVSCFSLLLQPQFGSPLWRGVGWLSCPPSAWSTGSSLLVGCGLKCSLEDVLGLVSRKLFGSREHSQLLNKRVRIYCIM